MISSSAYLCPDTGAKLTALVNSDKQCASSRKRNSMFDCAGNVAAMAIAQTGPGDALANLLLLPPGFLAADLIPVLATVLPTIIAAGQQIAMLAANPTEQGCPLDRHSDCWSLSTGGCALYSEPCDWEVRHIV